jgi:hypothetical protein
MGEVLIVSLRIADNVAKGLEEGFKKFSCKHPCRSSLDKCIFLYQSVKSKMK